MKCRQSCLKEKSGLALWGAAPPLQWRGREGCISVDRGGARWSPQGASLWGPYREIDILASLSCWPSILWRPHWLKPLGARGRGSC